MLGPNFTNNTRIFAENYDDFAGNQMLKKIENLSCCLKI